MKTQNLKLSLAALVAATSLAHPARAATLTVTSLADSGPGTLRQRIAAAANGDTINFKVTGTITLTSGQLTVNKKLNIIGPPPSLFGNLVTVSGNDQSRVFDITSRADVTISNLNIAHGYADNYAPDQVGGGIRNLGNLHLIACAIRDNVGRNGGGGIYNLGTLFVEDCRIQHNLTGSPFSASGAGILNLSKLKLVGSTIAQNNAVDVGGGLAHLSTSSSPAGQLEIVNCTFCDNRSSGGGGLYIRSTGDLQTALIDKTTVVANYGTDVGGIWAASSVSIKNSTISGNSGGNLGGGLGVDPFSTAPQPFTVSLNNVTITDNTVNDFPTDFDGNGAGVFIGRQPREIRLTAANCIIAGNQNPAGASDVFGHLDSLGHNLILDTTRATITGDQTSDLYGVSPELLPLAHNGGPTLTHALWNISPAVDHGGDSTCEATDQRGVVRPVGPHGDIGAYEGSIAKPFRPFVVDLLYEPAPYIIVCDPAGPFPPWQGSILGSREFDVRTINAKSLRLQTRTAGPLSLAYRDMNKDGIMDLVLSFDLNQALQGQVCEAVTQLDLTGLTRSDEPIFGAVQVEAVAR